MARSVRNTVLLAKVETTSGTDAAPTNTADAVLLFVNNFNCKIEQLFAERDVIRGFYGAPDKLPYTRRGTIGFSIDLAGSGTLGTAPQWGDLLIGCGQSETVTAAARVDYLPASSALKTLTLWAYVDGALRKFTYCAGSVKLGLKPGAAPTMDFTFQALVTDPTSAAVPVPTTTAWQRPVAVGPGNTTALSLGATYSAGALSGGTNFNFNDAQIDLANNVQDVVLVSQETIGVFNRAPTAEFTLDLSAANEVTQFTNMKAGTPTSFGLVHGTTAGNKVLIHAPNVILTGIEDALQGDVLLSKLVFALLPTTAGNDDLRIVSI